MTETMCNSSTLRENEIRLVSIAMATFNGESYIREQLESILNQSYSDIEVVIVDDCSTDCTVKIINEYLDDPRLRLIQNNVNLGYVKNFEKAISSCSGDFIALADQDDVWELHKIETLVGNIGDYDLIHSDAQLIDGTGNVIANSFTDFSKKLVSPKSVYNLAYNGCVTGCTCLFTRDFSLRALPFPEGVDVHDRWLGALAFASKKLKYTNYALVRYRQHGRNSIGATSVNTSALVLSIGWLARNYLRLFNVDKAFVATFRSHSAFINVIRNKLGFALSRIEDERLKKDQSLYDSTCNFEARIVDLINWYKVCLKMNVNAPYGYRTIFFLSVLRNVFLIMIGRRT